jgi:RHS repeat-associated protein
MYISGTTGPFETFGYDLADRLTVASRDSSQLVSTYTFDDPSRLTSITHTSSVAGTLSSFSYGYDNADRLTSSTGPEGSKTYTYDNTDQLTGVAGVNPESFSYDANGNRTMAGYSTGTGNRLTSDGTYNYTYDDEGNTLTQTRISDGQVTSFIWDNRNRLTEADIRDAGGNLLHQEKYTYDVLDRRIGVWIDADGAGPGAGVQTRTAYNGANAWADFDASGSLTTRYLMGTGMDSLLARVPVAGAVGWYLTDNLGSVRQIAQTTGTVVYSANYSAFGTIQSESGTGGDRFKFTGREWDAGTGQYYFRARYYGAGVGRFRSQDSVGFAAGDVDLYRYGRNNSAASTDPTGNMALAAVGGAALAATPVGWTILLIVVAVTAAVVIANAYYDPTLGAIVGDIATDLRAGVRAVEDGVRALTKRTPAKGTPNTTEAFNSGDGTGTIREFGPDGRASTDFDFGHDHGAGNPHAHDWDWNRIPPRQPGRPLRPGE